MDVIHRSLQMTTPIYKQRCWLNSSLYMTPFQRLGLNSQRVLRRNIDDCLCGMLLPVNAKNELVDIPSEGTTIRIHIEDLCVFILQT